MLCQVIKGSDVTLRNNKYQRLCYYTNNQYMKDSIVTNISGLFLLVLLASSGLFACASGNAVRLDDDLPAYEGPITVEVLKARTFPHIVNSVRAEVKGAVSIGDGGRSAFSGVFAFRSPSELRVRLFGPLGATVVDMVNAGGVFQVHDTGGHRLYEGPGLFLDAPPDIEPHITHQDGLIYLVQYAPSNDGSQAPREVFVFDGRTLRNTGIILYRDGEPFVNMEFGEFTGRVPGRVRMAISRGPVIDLQLQLPEVNIDVPDKVFRLVLHEGNEVLPISAIDSMTFSW